MGLPVSGAYIWRGLYLEGLIFGILRYVKYEKSREDLLNAMSAGMRGIRLLFRVSRPNVDDDEKAFSAFSLLPATEKAFMF